MFTDLSDATLPTDAAVGGGKRTISVRGRNYVIREGEQRFKSGGFTIFRTTPLTCGPPENHRKGRVSLIY
jgi:hypothetical protein